MSVVLTLDTSDREHAILLSALIDAGHTVCATVRLDAVSDLADVLGDKGLIVEPEPEPAPKKRARKKAEPEPEPVTYEELAARVVAMADAGEAAKVRQALAVVGARRLRDVDADDLPRVAEALSQ